MKSIFPHAVLIALFPAICHAGAWTQKQGELQFINTLHYYKTDSFFDTSGDKQSQPEFTKAEWNPYAEYGLTDSLTLGVNAFLHRVTSNSNAPSTVDSNWGLSDTELFARQKIWEQDGMVLALQPLVKLPSFYQHGELPQSGTDDFDVEAMLQGGYSFSAYGQHHFIAADIGYRARGGEPNDQVKANITVGARLDENWLILPQLFSTWRTNSSTGATFTQSGQDDYNLVKLQLSAAYALDESTTVQLGGYSHVWAENSGAGGGVILSLWKQF